MPFDLNTEREHWLVDEEASEVVRRIFSLTLEGYGPYQIACKLSIDRIEIPVVHLARFNEGVNLSLIHICGRCPATDCLYCGDLPAFAAVGATIPA